MNKDSYLQVSINTVGDDKNNAIDIKSNCAIGVFYEAGTKKAHATFFTSCNAQTVYFTVRGIVSTLNNAVSRCQPEVVDAIKKALQDEGFCLIPQADSILNDATILS